MTLIELLAYVLAGACGYGCVSSLKHRYWVEAVIFGSCAGVYVSVGILFTRLAEMVAVFEAGR